ncbi:hypothetical protein PPERSA_00694 [Pseudocohnilembus persalinus]|uniref:Uncharacterized protein n=1 Tax=Pseudocohnilembus persalinus TaxID=266149 RepID=A0A0V0QT76_PSEPJ|nr:hypothetical protein PPERSA_00694 [Pseudocohnilembus persalinus]|eukprot:KRX05393.1 hypothetical protein PPERSA_00694 [Pseudocohnilembus persalinus]
MVLICKSSPSKIYYFYLIICIFRWHPHSIDFLDSVVSQQNIFWLQISVCKLFAVNKPNRLQNLFKKTLNPENGKPFILIFLNHVEQTGPQLLKNNPIIFSFIHRKSVIQSNYLIFIFRVPFLQFLYNSNFSFSAVNIPFHRSNNLHRFNFFALQISHFKNPPKSPVRNPLYQLVLSIISLYNFPDFVLIMSCVFASVLFVTRTPASAAARTARTLLTFTPTTLILPALFALTALILLLILPRIISIIIIIIIIRTILLLLIVFVVLRIVVVFKPVVIYVNTSGLIVASMTRTSVPRSVSVTVTLVIPPIIIIMIIIIIIVVIIISVVFNSSISVSFSAALIIISIFIIRPAVIPPSVTIMFSVTVISLSIISVSVSIFIITVVSSS